MKNNIIYSGNEEITAKEIKILDDMILKITFSNSEIKLFDVKQLLYMPAFQILKNKTIFEQPKIEYGVVTWDNGNVDIAPETLYNNSYQYKGGD